MIEDDKFLSQAFPDRLSVEKDIKEGIRIAKMKATKLAEIQTLLSDDNLSEGHIEEAVKIADSITYSFMGQAIRRHYDCDRNKGQDHSTK